ncbi:MAG TPA: substrate-binding domain-containing protein, partial [Actinomycetes bacterium]|nr:substrate-binding domain-containing protein [Actinomycetes bacterium]
MNRTKRLVIAAALVTLTLGACTSDDNGNQANQTASTPAGQGGDVTIAVVTHGSAGDAFWDVVKNGAEAAGRDLGVTVSYQGNGDPAQQSQLIDTAVSQGVDGIVVSMANPDALEESIKAAVAAGIPVITINSGADRSKEFGAITHVGQTETVAGAGAGEQLKAAGVTKLLCVIHEAGNVGLT